MNYLNNSPLIQGAEEAQDAHSPLDLPKQKLQYLTTQLEHHPTHSLNRAYLLLELGLIQLQLEQRVQAWETAQEAFNIFALAEEWEGAVQGCHIMFLANQENSLVALGNGIWLAVTYPIDIEMSVMMLEHLVDETPDHSDGAAIAGATAHYLVDLRAQGGSPQRENLLFYTNQLLAKVARRHSQVEDQNSFKIWFKQLELDVPEKFIKRLSQILEVLVQGQWWIDKEALRTKLPL